jgi:hypothetical protein
VGLCIESKHTCDGFDNCGNNADEELENCTSISDNNFALDDSDMKTEDRKTSLSLVTRLVVGLGGTVGVVSVILLIAYLIRRWVIDKAV